MVQETKNIGYKITIFLLSIIILLLIFEKVRTIKQKNELVTKVELTNQQKDSLKNELMDLYFSYDSLETNNQAINDSLDAQKQKIEELMQQLKNVKANDYARIQQLKKEVETLKKIMKSYVRQIDSLYQQNQILIAENTQIKHQYQEVVEIKEELTTKNDSLQQTVKVAQQLTAYSPVILALNKRGKSTTRINKVDKFKICFLLSENKIAPKGRKYIYIRVTKPDGEVLRNENSGFFNYDGESIAYSSKKEIEYDGTAQDVCIFYDVKVEDLPSGKYTIFIFADGKQIGDQTIILK